MASEAGRRGLGVKRCNRIRGTVSSISGASGQPEPNPVSSSVGWGESRSRNLGGAEPAAARLAVHPGPPPGPDPATPSGPPDALTATSRPACRGLFLQLPPVVLTGLFCF